MEQSNMLIMFKIFKKRRKQFKDATTKLNADNHHIGNMTSFRNVGF